MGRRRGRSGLSLGVDAIDDIAFLKVTSVILIMVVISSMAQADGNNPLSEIGIPFDADSFNIYALGEQAPQIELITPIDYSGPRNETQKVCWIDWWCPDLPGSDVANAIHSFAVSFTNIVFMIVNGILYGGTIVVLLILNFVIIFNFTGWGAFQGNFLLVLFGIGLTALLGGSIILWIYSKIMGSLPFVGGTP